MTAEESLKWIGEDLLKQCPGYIKKPVPWPGTSEVFRLDVPAFTVDFLKLQRCQYRLSTDGTILSASVFRIQETVTIYDCRGEPTHLQSFAESVILDPEACRQPRLVEMMEDSRHILARLSFHHPDPVEYRTLRPEPTPLEQELEHLAEYLLMPDSVLIPMMQHRGFEPIIFTNGTFSPDEDRLLHHMMTILNVPRSSLLHRLKDAGFLTEQ